MNKTQTAIITASIILTVVLGVIYVSFPPINEQPDQASDPNSAWVEEKGVRLSLNHSGQVLLIGETLSYTVELKNVNSSSQLYLYQSAGYTWHEIQYQNGSVIKSMTGRYAWGPPGQPEETFRQGDIWLMNSPWNIQLPSGNYTHYVKVRYGIINQESETIEISVPIEIIEGETIFGLSLILKLLTVDGKDVPLPDETNTTEQFNLQFDEEGIMSGRGGCNGFTGKYQLSNEHKIVNKLDQGEYLGVRGKISFGPLLSTSMGCVTSSLMEQENQYFEALSQVTSFQVLAKNLKLTSNDEQTVLNFIIE